METRRGLLAICHTIIVRCVRAWQMILVTLPVAHLYSGMKGCPYVYISAILHKAGRGSYSKMRAISLSLLAGEKHFSHWSQTTFFTHIGPRLSRNRLRVAASTRSLHQAYHTKLEAQGSSDILLTIPRMVDALYG